MCDIAAVVTCGSEELAGIIRRETGREAVVIEEPFEGPEEPPRFDGGRRVLWFGHAAGLHNLRRVAGEISGELLVCTNATGEGVIPWSPQNQASALQWCDLVILPQEDRWKSANRAVAALRAGRYAVADDVPSYEGICWTEGVLEGVEWVRANPGSITERILSGQRHIRERFDPKRIARQWSDCIWGAAKSVSPVS